MNHWLDLTMGQGLLLVKKSYSEPTLHVTYGKRAD